ncbi:hypothetical protein MG293_017208 [Ovis ammon polii]|uniref:Uncharacterized protein n=1 Tax=Ovis ammon polii TaxID=230172 RepID=A0AAD4TV09_OVIAM|nr:hypothetical protein MG293_017208 [Ovis ammon polii]KAI4555146.1 hypothetical protein MJT46_015532 [Ovis ammon polii x Ovis aries]
MGLCHSLRPLLFGDTEPPVEGARSDLNPMPDLDLAPVLTPAQERRRRTDRQRAEEREARRVSRSIDRRLREQRRDLRRTHRLLLLESRSSFRFVRCGPCAQGRERDATGAKVQSARPAGASSCSSSERNSLYSEQPGDVRCDSKPESLMLLILVPFKD